MMARNKNIPIELRPVVIGAKEYPYIEVVNRSAAKPLNPWPEKFNPQPGNFEDFAHDRRCKKCARIIQKITFCSGWKEPIKVINQSSFMDWAYCNFYKGEYCFLAGEHLHYACDCGVNVISHPFHYDETSY